MGYLTNRDLKRHGMRLGAYDGASRRRFVVFTETQTGIEMRSEFDSKGEREEYLRRELEKRRAGPVSDLLPKYAREARRLLRKAGAL